MYILKMQNKIGAAGDHLAWLLKAEGLFEAIISFENDRVTLKELKESAFLVNLIHRYQSFYDAHPADSVLPPSMVKLTRYLELLPGLDLKRKEPCGVSREQRGYRLANLSRIFDTMDLIENLGGTGRFIMNIRLVDGVMCRSNEADTSTLKKILSTMVDLRRIPLSQEIGVFAEALANRVALDIYETA